jgi:hypothetical protein
MLYIGVQNGIMVESQKKLTLIKMALLTFWFRMAQNMVCPCSVFSPADSKILSEDTNKMSKSQQLIDTT